MAMKGRAVHKNYTHTLYIYRVILTNLYNGCLSWSFLGKYKRDWNLLHTLMLKKGSVQNKNHTPILHFTWVISSHFLFIKGGFLCHVLVYKLCQNTSSAFYRQQAFGEHSSLPAGKKTQ